MFENLIKQDAGKLISSDIRAGKFPGAVLFAGPQFSGKLTAALETARVLSCQNEKKGAWSCECNSCLQNKALTSQNLLLLGPRDCLLEIYSAKKYFLQALKTSAPYILAARYFYIRSVRKLTLRFNSILWKGDSSLNKISAIIEELNEEIEKIDLSRQLNNIEEIEKSCEKIDDFCKKLDNELYNSIPVSQIRNMEEWAYIKSENGKKTIILENAEKMQASVRNALLKILEEPPRDCIFILLTNNRNAVMQTILSRVRTYNFSDRSIEEQKDVISRILHTDYSGSIRDYLLTFLPVKPEVLQAQAQYFIKEIASKNIPDISQLVKKCENFIPRVELKLFLNFIALEIKNLQKNQPGCEAIAQAMTFLQKCYDNVTLYNLTPLSSLEILLRDLSMINIQNNGVFSAIL